MNRVDRRSRAETTPYRVGSRFFVPLLILGGCAGAGAGGEAAPKPVANTTTEPPTPIDVDDDAPAMSTDEPVAHGETCLGVGDKGIWSDLDDRVQLALPASVPIERVAVRLDRARSLAVVFVDGFPVKPYPLTGDAKVAVAGETFAVRAGDRAELARVTTARAMGDDAGFGDRDADGIPNPLDVRNGAEKTALNADDYPPGYFTLKYPMGDMPRTQGVCTDVVIRALRNAGLDLQVEVQRDIRRRRAAYPMVKRNGDASIDHRRVRTLLPYFM